MTPRPDRPSEWGTIGEHEQRIRVLEALDTTGGGGLVTCTGCYEVDPEFADCVDLTPGSCIDQAQVDPLTFNPADPDDIGDARWACGPYGCNYAAGFRLQMRYIGLNKRVALWVQPVPVGGTPDIGEWTQMPTPIGNTTLIQIDTGWVTIPIDAGAPADTSLWEVVVGYTNGSALFDGTYGAGSLCGRWVSADDLANYVPQSQNAGDILVSVGSPPEWMILPAGTVGQVLTIGAGGLPEWA